MDIFKLFFNHDQRLDKTVERNANKTVEEKEAALEDFMKPTPTFSKFYLTGTRVDKNKFGLNRLEKYSPLMEKLDAVFDEFKIHTSDNIYPSFSKAVEEVSIGCPILLSPHEEVETDLNQLRVNEESNVGHFKNELRNPLLKGQIVIYKEQAKNGFDLHIFSKQNIYEQLFCALQALIDDSFRFFSINSKRMRSERHFYFETWTLHKPPHGAEEVFADTKF